MAVLNTCSDDELTADETEEGTLICIAFHTFSNNRIQVNLVEIKQFFLQFSFALLHDYSTVQNY